MPVAAACVMHDVPSQHAGAAVSVGVVVAASIDDDAPRSRRRRVQHRATFAVPVSSSVLVVHADDTDAASPACHVLTRQQTLLVVSR